MLDATAIDHAVGKLIQALEDLNLNDNTLVIFTSEHGDMLMSKGVLKKQRPWDESITSPFSSTTTAPMCGPIGTISS